MLAGVAAERGWMLFTWPFWLDEYHTLFLAEKGSLIRSLSDLAAGVDFNPPTLFLIYRLIAQVAGPLTPITVRIASFLMVWLALVFVFLTLRRTVPRSAAFVGAIAVWCHALTVEHAFEARYYNPWLLFAALAAWSFGLDDALSVSRRRNIAVGVSSVLVCTIHYFGIFSLMLLASGWACVIIARRQNWSRMLPLAAGPIALALCAPLYIGQRRALTLTTWIPAVDAGQVREMLATYFVKAPFLICLFVAGASAAWYSIGRTRKSPGIFAPAIELLPLLCLLLMPIVVIAFSLLVQPSMLTRYAIAGVLGWAGIAALAAAALPRTGRLMLGLLLSYLGLTPIEAWIRRVNELKEKIATEAAAVRPFVNRGVPIFVPTRHSLYPLAYETSRPNQLVYPDFSDSTARQRQFSPSRIVERDVARVHNARYGFPRLMRIDDPAPPSELVVLLPKPAPASELGEWFPGRKFEPVGPQMYRVFLTNSGDSAALVRIVQPR
jgi:hypothetical protein